MKDGTRHYPYNVETALSGRRENAEGFEEETGRKNHPRKLKLPSASRAALDAAPGTGISGWGLAVQSGLHHGPNDQMISQDQATRLL